MAVLHHQSDTRGELVDAILQEFAGLTPPHKPDRYHIERRIQAFLAGRRAAACPWWNKVPPAPTNHDGLMRDLAGYLFVHRECFTATNMAITDGVRPDVLAIPLTSKWGDWRGSALAFEIKVSRADFLSDVRSEKWKGYLGTCAALWFATPSGLIRTEELPKGAGLIERSSAGWRQRKSPARPLDRQAASPMLLLTLLTRMFWSARMNRCVVPTLNDERDAT